MASISSLSSLVALHSSTPALSIPNNFTSLTLASHRLRLRPSSPLTPPPKRHHRHRPRPRPAPASPLPIITCQTPPGFSPHFHTNFYKVEAILRTWRIPQVSSALLKMGIRGVTISDVRGFGAQGGLKERHAGSEFSEDSFIGKVKMEIVVHKDQVEDVVQVIIDVARTGEIGDGKIFLIPVSDVIRIRTGERGEHAERMSGGRAEESTAGAGSPWA